MIEDNNKKSNLEDLYIIDSLGIIFKNYYARKDNPILNYKNENISGAVAFFKFLINLIYEERPKNLISVFDSPVKTVRKIEYPEYKANREKTPENLILQIRLVLDELKKNQIATHQIEGYEADDIIASLVKKAESKYRVYILSSDKDLFQLISENTYVIKHKGNEKIKIDKEFIIKKYGIDSTKFTDYLSIVGDQSDNIPGIKGIGKVGAVKLLKKFDNIKNIYNKIDKKEYFGILPKDLEMLVKERNNALLSYELIKLKEDLPIPELKELRTKNEDIKKIKKILDKIKNVDLDIYKTLPKNPENKE